MEACALPSGAVRYASRLKARLGASQDVFSKEEAAFILPQRISMAIIVVLKSISSRVATATSITMDYLIAPPVIFALLIVAIIIVVGSVVYDYLHPTS